MAPRLSFVLVVHREQAYLGECLESVLGQGLEDVEVVAIDDASPDHVPALLDEFARRDPRVRVHHLSQRVGIGEGCNLGLELARGGHVWFVHTTDLLVPGALPAIARRLEGASTDVLLLSHLRADQLGRERPGGRQQGLADASPHGFDKLFRTALLRELGVRFGAGGFSALSVSWPALLCARAIAAEAQPAYVRREPANAVRDRLATGSVWDVFAQYDAVFDFIDAHGGPPEDGRRTVAQAMLRHELGLLARVPGEQRAAFFGRMSEGLRGERLSGLRARLVQRDEHGAYRALQTAQRTRRVLLRRGRRLPVRVRRRAPAGARDEGLQGHYRTRLREPIDPDLAVFAAYWYRGYACNPKAIYERARVLVPSMRGVWVVKPEGVDGLPAGIEHVIAGSEEYYDVIARARYLVNNVNFPDHLVKRAGTTHVMTHHGTPLKRMGLDLRHAERVNRAPDLGRLLRRCARWDFSVSSNAFSTLVWERAFPTRYESLEVGYPRNDALATATDEQIAEVRAGLGIGPRQRVVLYAPTHREYEPEWTSPLDLGALADGLGPDYVVMARLHYFYGEDPRVAELHREGRILDVAGHPAVEDLCLAADVLLTDYSSIMFDFGVLDRPVVIHAPDWETYRRRRGTYFDLLAEPPGVVATTGAEVLQALCSGAAWGEQATQDRTAFRARFCSLDDGRAAERVVRRVWLGEREAILPQAAAVTP